MKLGFVFDTRFIKYKDNYYSTSLSSEMLTERYLSVFDEMVVVGRYKEVEDSPKGKLVQCNTDRISFQCIKDEHPLRRIFHFGRENSHLKNVLKDCDSVICRGWRGTEISRKFRKPYLVEVVNCAWDSYWNHGFLGKIVAPLFFLIRKFTTRSAPYVIYVTNNFLQKRYPTNGKTVSISNVALSAYDDGIIDCRLDKILNKADGDKLVLGTAAAIDVPFKGQRFVIKALAKLKKQGKTNFEYQLVGYGDNSKLKKLAQRLDVLDQVVFKGSIIHDDMFDWFDSLDVYIQPSLQEGLPRAMIEAMSRGLPCYGTKTGGIPELINSNYVCKNNLNIGNKIARFLDNHTREKAIDMAKENFEEAKKYKAEILKDRRYSFLVDFSKSGMENYKC